MTILRHLIHKLVPSLLHSVSVFQPCQSLVIFQFDTSKSNARYVSCIGPHIDRNGMNDDFDKISGASQRDKWLFDEN